MLQETVNDRSKTVGIPGHNAMQHVEKTNGLKVVQISRNENPNR